MIEETEARYRLPRTVTPARYELALEPDLSAGTFAGTQVISVTVHESVTEIVLNAVDLEITEGSLEAADGRRIEISKARVDADTERAHLELDATADPGAWTLNLAFSGVLNDKLVGFYRSTYEGPAGEAEVIATSHFEATDARRAFPCWDEPDMKAVFGVTLIVQPDLTALSNGPEIEREPLEDGRVRVRFADTMLDVDVPRRVRRRPPGAHRSRGRRRRAHARRTRPREGTAGRVRARCGSALAAVVRRLLRHPVSRPEGRPRGAPGLRPGRDGEPRLHHVPRGGAPGRAGHGHA